MATPRVFVSSTYYDLRHVRDDIEVFLKGLGYVPVMHDKGSVTYTQDVSLEQSCYKELSTCDIVVCIIGSKYGTQSSGSDFSITMEELREAMRMRKKVYIYILKDVYSENYTYDKNKKTGFFEPFHADNIKIHEFISVLKDTVKSSPIQPFEAVSDITSNLKMQLAGLFQYLLAQEAIITESKTYADLQNAASDIRVMIDDFAREKEAFFDKFDGSIYDTSLVVRKIQKLLNICGFRVFVKDKNGLIEFMNTMDFKYVDEPFDGKIKFHKQDNTHNYMLSLAYELFNEDDTIKKIRSSREIDAFIQYQFSQKTIILDDLPF